MPTSAAGSPAATATGASTPATPDATTADVTTGERCPECAAGLGTPDPRYRTWCPSCEWNITAAAAPATTGRWTARRTAARERAVRKRVERAYELVEAGAPDHRDAAWLGAVVLAGLVHLSSLALLAGSVLALLTPGVPMRVVGVLGLLITFLARPRLGRLRGGPGVLTRDRAPALYALADRVAAEVGTRPVHSIEVTGTFGASVRKAGLRRRTRLTVGLQLWESLTPQQRVALLAHEFGHNVNGDHRRGLWLGTARATLHEWLLLTHPDSVGRGPALAAVVARVLFRVVGMAVYGVLDLLSRLTVRSGQLAEYRADAIAAQVASAPAVRGLLECLLHEQTAVTVVTRRRAMPAQGRRPAGSSGRQPTGDLWTELAEQIATVSPREVERRRRLSARDFGAVDSTHPPTHLRLRMLEDAPAAEPALPLDAAGAAAVEADLAPQLARIARALEHR